MGEGDFPALPLDRSVFPNAPARLFAAVYFPTATLIPTPTRFTGALPLPPSSNGFSLVLYGHALRTDFEPVDGHPLNRDFTTVDTILSHLASYGCVCLAPDLSWSAGEANREDWQREAVIFTYLYQFLGGKLNHELFNDQVNLSNVIMVGHSHRAGTVVNAGRALPLVQGPKTLAYGLIAPEDGGDTASDINNVLVLGGMLDYQELQDSQPIKAYKGSAVPKTQVLIPGANHYGYTDLVGPNNEAVCDCTTGQINLLDSNGTISRVAQQQIGAAYLAAMVRYYALGDATTRGYLAGQEVVDGLDGYGIQVQAAGFGPLLLPTAPPTRATQP